MREVEEIKNTFRDGRRSEALQRCETLCLNNPENIEVKRLCALMHGMMGNYRDSGRYLRQVLDIDSNDAEALFNIGVCERSQLNFKDAERHYLNYTRKFPKQADGWVNLAECQFHLNDFAPSLRSAGAALALDPASTEAWTTQGDCLKALNRHQEALASYRKASQVRPNAVASANQGVLLLELGDRKSTRLNSSH